MKRITSKAGKVLVGRMYELYTGDCPPERPCTKEMVEEYKKLYDDPETYVPPVSQPEHRKLLLWKWLGQAMSYYEAMSRWRQAGSPVPPADELEFRRRTCFACSKHDHERDGCKVCGCGVEAGSLAEKRSMSTEECPDVPPRWKALVVVQ